jgi:hypothetical protein
MYMIGTASKINLTTSTSTSTSYRESGHRGRVDNPSSISPIRPRHPLHGEEDSARRTHQHHLQVQLPAMLKEQTNPSQREK